MALRVSKRAQIKGKIAGYMTTYGKTADWMALQMKMSTSSWYRRMQKPGTFSVEELEKLELITGLELIVK